MFCFCASITVHLPFPGKTVSVNVLSDIGDRTPRSIRVFSGNFYVGYEVNKVNSIVIPDSNDNTK